VGVKVTDQSVTVGRIVGAKTPEMIRVQLDEAGKQSKDYTLEQVQSELFTIDCMTLSLGQDVMHLLRGGMQAESLHMGMLVGVRRGNGRITAGVIVHPVPGETDPQYVRLLMEPGDGAKASSIKQIKIDDIQEWIFELLLTGVSSPDLARLHRELPPLGYDPKDMLGPAVETTLLLPGTLVGVRRSAGNITVGRVGKNAPDFPREQVRVFVNESGDYRDSPRSQLFLLNLPSGWP
jgi:hypothetical protein